MAKKASFGSTVAETITEITPEMVAEMLAVPPDFEELLALRTNYVVQEITIKEILEAEQAGQIDPDQADELVVGAIEDHSDTQAEILGLDPVIVDAPEMMQAPMSRAPGKDANFSAVFSETLANLIDAEFETPEDAISTLSVASGLTPDAVVGMVSGQLAPDLSQNMDVLEGIASVFDNLQENNQAYQEFIDLGTRAYEQVVNQVPQTASMSSADYALRAEFAALQEKEAIGENLRNVERHCDRGCAEGWLTPNEAQILLGRFEERSDRVAAFSAACEESNTSPRDELMCLNHYLYIAEQRGPLAEFGKQVDTIADPIVPADTQSVEYAQEYRDRNGYK